MNLLRLFARTRPDLLLAIFPRFLAPALIVAAYLMGTGPLHFTRGLGPYATYGAALLTLGLCLVLQTRAIHGFVADFHESIATVRATIVKRLVTSELQVVNATRATEIAAVLEGDARLVASVAPSVASTMIMATWTLTTLVLAAYESWRVLVVYVGLFGMVYLVRSFSSNQQASALGDAAESRLRIVFDDLMAAPRSLIVNRPKALGIAEAGTVYAREAADRRIEGTKGFARVVAGTEAIMLLAILAAREVSNGLLPGPPISDALMVLLTVTAGPFVNLVHARFELLGADRAARRMLVLDAGLGAVPRVPDAIESEPQFDRIRFQGVVAARTPRPGEAPFQMGPVDLTLERGSVTVIVGANGSGKSTLVETILGFLKPTSGSILLDDQAIGTKTLDGYRSLFSPVFATPHLFDRLYGHREARGAAQERLDWLGLTKVAVDAPHEVTRSLSTGQQKRVALARAVAEDKPILVLDEYTADQDATARARFLDELLPALKKEGRTVIAILHASSIPGCADQVITVAQGRITTTAGAQVSS